MNCTYKAIYLTRGLTCKEQKIAYNKIEFSLYEEQT